MAKTRERIIHQQQGLDFRGVQSQVGLERLGEVKKRKFNEEKPGFYFGWGG